jgi:hypothetical protein
MGRRVAIAQRQNRSIVPRAWLAVTTPSAMPRWKNLVLRSRDDLRNPCRAFGPLTLEFYTDLLGIGSRH